jgi:hypothetical protein
MSDEPCPYVTGTVTRYCTLTPFTLTDAEREAIERAINTVKLFDGYDRKITKSLRGLLERTIVRA